MTTLLLLGVTTALAADSYQDVLDRYVDPQGNVDYAALAAARALDGHVASLATATEPPLGPERTAFWINAYNALTIDLVADSWPLASIMDLDGGKVWDTRTFAVAGRSVTLNAIEHEILRPLGDPRIHAALNCASRGCPPLSRSAFSGDGLEVQLDQAARRWVATNALDLGRGAVGFNRIFDWYGDDFVPGVGGDIPGVEGKAEAAAWFAASYLPAEQAALLRAGGYRASWTDYDWAVNARLP